MVTAFASADVYILADFQKAFRADHRQATIAPRAQPIGREPIHANVPRAAIAAQQHITEVFKVGMLRMIHVAHLCGDNFGLRGASEK